MNKKRLFLDIHAIQSVPPSNINRDDTGTPKTAQYGGVKRARVSSQSWKRAMRNYFYDNSIQSNIGTRSLEIVTYVADKIKEIDQSLTDEEALDLADKTINKAGIKTKDKKAKALFFLGEIQARKLAQAAVNTIEDKKELKEILKNNPAIDIALFGRMVADDPSLNEDASSQVAHSISTHAVQTEFDFFTAVDDLAPQDNAGAGMLGTIEFNSSTLYRYANVAVHELVEQLQDREVTVKTLGLFIEAFSNSLPTGKSNTFANQTIPQAILVTLRTDRPVNLVNAFEEPVESNDGYAKNSIEKLLKEQDKANKFVEEPILNLFLTTEDVQHKSSTSLNSEDTLRSLVENFEIRINDQLATEDE